MLSSRRFGASFAPTIQLCVPDVFSFTSPISMTAKRLTIWMVAADLLWTLASFLCAGLLRYGPGLVADHRLIVFALLPFVAASMVLWALLFPRFPLDGFQGGWHFPAVVSR